jgi:hypothetical protein
MQTLIGDSEGLFVRSTPNVFYIIYSAIVLAYTYRFCWPACPISPVPHFSTFTCPEKKVLALGILIFGKPPISLFTVLGGVLGGVATIFCT